MPAREVPSIFEQYIIDALVHLANGWASFRYSEGFLRGTYENRRHAMGAWAAIYTAGQFLIAETSDMWSPYDRIWRIVPCFLLLFFLQRVFFEKDRPRQAFTIASFEAGWEILRFAASPIAHAIFSVWSPLWAWTFEQEAVLSSMPAEKLLSVMEAINRIVMFLVIALCRAIQVGTLVLYLRMIRQRFVPQGYELDAHDSLFLLFPCLTVLCIDTTLRLMAFSLDNGAMMLVYDRVPATLLLLPLASMLLLGMVISSVSLFRNLVQRKDEEQKRALLENRIAHMHREMEELQDIYGDIRGLRHDLRSHIANLAAYVRKNAASPERNEEMEGYLCRMADTVARLDFADRTGNPITDIILHQARQQAKKKGIAFSADFRYPQEQGLDVYDVSIILGNALQNALEACERMEGDRGIAIRSYRKGSLFFLEVENDFAGELHWQPEDHLPATTKPERRLHGIGLANIRRAAQKYRGDIDIQIAERDGKRRFCLTVMLYERIEANDFAQRLR